MKRRVIIPAAGKGSRLHGTDKDLPKVMRECAGKPLLETVLESTSFIAPEDTYIVVGYKKETVTEYFGDKYNYVEQREQLGTGHAVMMCEDAFKEFDGTVLIDYGDMPLFRYDDMKRTVKRFFSPCPQILITTPRYNCMRSLLPSMIRYATVTVSPDLNEGCCFPVANASSAILIKSISQFF